MRARRLSARWLIPVEGPAVERGALLIGSDGRILEVGHSAVVSRPSDIPAEEFDDAIILPGLINAHTHLELTGFEDRVSERDFPAWIRRLRAVKATRSSAQYLEAARSGLRACYAAGVTTVADTGDSGAAIQALAEAEGSGVAYQEVFGPHPAQVAASLAGLQDRVSRLSGWARGRVRIGVSPHAPYTVSAPLFQRVAEWSRAEGLPLAVHIAESPAESEFLGRASGPFAEAWKSRGIPLPEARGQSPLAWLSRLGVLAEQTLCIHAVQLGTQDIHRLGESGAAVAHCPLSNRAHGHGSAPLAALLAGDIRVGIGTDSVVSVGRLDLLAEARAAGSLATLTADELVRLSTLSGARAIGLDSETGSLRPGKWGDCVVLRMSARPGDTSPAAQVLASSPGDVVATYLGGREVHRSL